MRIRLLYIRRGMGHLRVKVEVPEEDKIWPLLTEEEAMHAIEGILERRENLQDNDAILIPIEQLLRQVIFNRWAKKDWEKEYALQQTFLQSEGSGPVGS